MHPQSSIKLEGIITALATPFHQDEIDKKSWIKLLHQQLESNISALVINGTTGESPCLTPEEVYLLYSIAKVECQGALDLILGIGSYSTKTALYNIKQAEKWGATAALAVTPYYNKPPERGLVKHFSTLAKSTSLPIILYNVPSRTGINLSIETLKELSQFQNIQIIKEASGDMDYGKKIIQQDSYPWQVLSGDDISCMQLISLGATGVISVFSHILGTEMYQIYKKIRAGETQIVQTYQQKYHPLLKAIYSETNPIGIKMALKLLGIFRSEEMRSPLVPLAKDKTKILQAELKKAKLL